MFSQKYLLTYFERKQKKIFCYQICDQVSKITFGYGTYDIDTVVAEWGVAFDASEYYADPGNRLIVHRVVNGPLQPFA